MLLTKVNVARRSNDFLRARTLSLAHHNLVHSKSTELPLPSDVDAVLDPVSNRILGVFDGDDPITEIETVLEIPVDNWNKLWLCKLQVVGQLGVEW